MQHQQKKNKDKNKNKATKDLLYRFAGLDEDARDLYASMEEDPASSSTAALRLSKNASTSSSSSSSSSTTFLTLDDLEAASLPRVNNTTTKAGATLKRSYSSNDSDKLAARTNGALCPSPSLALRACLRLDLKKEEYQSFVFSIRNKAWHPGDVVPISDKGKSKEKDQKHQSLHPSLQDTKTPPSTFNAPSYDSRLVFVVNHGCAPVYVKGKAELPLVIVEE